MLNDILANVMSLILNNENIGRMECKVKPSSKVVLTVLKIMKDHNYVKEFKEIKNTRGGEIEIILTGKINKCGVIKPRFAININEYEKFEKRYLPAKNFGILIISTSKGIMTHEQAKDQKIGGKLLAYCY